MKLLIALVVVSAVSVNAGEDWKMFMKWAKTKAMESCWGEENMKLHTLNMKKAVSKCLQVDAPETELPPFRYLNRVTNNLVNMANNNHMDMDHMDMDMFSKMFKSMKSNNYDSYKKDDYSPMMKRFMGGFQKRQADDSLELNDRLKEKLENLMQEHVSELSNMTCI